MITTEYIELNIAMVDSAVTNIKPTTEQNVLLYGIMNALLAQAKVQLLSVQQAAEDRAIRMEQMEIGKSMMGMFGGMGGASRGESKDGLKEFIVHLTTGEDIVVLASSERGAMDIVKERLKDLELDSSVVSNATPVVER